jgi:hypothetical protein
MSPIYIINITNVKCKSLDSSVGIMMGYRLDGLFLNGINEFWKAEKAV